MASLSVTGDFNIPADPRAPLRFNLEEHALRVAVARRESLNLLNASEWNLPGIYVLIGTHDEKTHKTKVYVGKSAQKNGVRGRLMTQNTKPTPAANFPWVAVAAFVRFAEGFSSSQVGYLEGRLAGKLRMVPSLDVQAGKRDEDKTLKPEQLATLDAFIPSFLAGLRLAGLQVNPVTAEAEDEQDDETIDPSKPGKKKRYSVSIAQLVEVGSLAAGDELIYERTGKSQTCTVTGDGVLLVDGAEYGTPSAAARAAFPGEVKAAPGWDVWRRKQGGKTLGELRDEYLDYISGQTGPA